VNAREELKRYGNSIAPDDSIIREEAAPKAFAALRAVLDACDEWAVDGSSIRRERIRIRRTIADVLRGESQ
jgi:hypothetical protein